MAQKKETEKLKKETTKKDVVKEKKVSKKKEEKVETVKNVSTITKKKSEPKVLEVKEDVKQDKVVTENKKLNIFNIILVISCILLIVVAFFISFKESSEKGKYYNQIAYSDVEGLLNDDEINIIYWASPTCGYCTQFKPIIMDVSSKYELPFNYLNVSSLNDDEYATMYTYFAQFDEVYNEENLGTPSLILVKNGEVLDISVGALTNDELVSYLQGHGLIK